MSIIKGLKRNLKYRLNFLTGFSLIEVVIAMAIMLIGVVGVLELFPVGLRASKRGEIMTKVGFLGQKKLEEMKVAGYDTISLLDPAVPLEGSEGPYDWAVSVEEVSLEGADSSDVCKLVVTIGWIERGRRRQKDFITYVTP